MNITEFLAARLAEDEQIARTATRGGWGMAVDEPSERTWLIISYDEELEEAALICEGDREGGGVYHTEDAAHIVSHDPARVLREIEAKRAILAEYTDYVAMWEEEREAPDGVGALQAVIAHMSAVYSDHPDFKEEWLV